MKKHLWLLSGFLGFTLLLAPVSGAPVKAGFAERDITPAIGMEKPGGYGKSYNRFLHDPCKVRAVVFDDGKKRIALVGIDALVIRRVNVENVRKKVKEMCGIEPGSVLIGASHSHSSGPTGMILPGEFDQANEFVQELAYVKSSNADAGYLEEVERRLVDVIVAADGKKTAVEVGFASGHEPNVSFNRRFRMKNGQTHTHPRYGNPDMLEPAGPIDPEVGVIGVWDKKSGEILGCVVNFACHATTSPGGISANYPWYLEKVIKDVMGDKIVTVFLNGASGDITQVDNQTPYQMKRGEGMAKIVGGSVAAEALKQLWKMPRGTDVTVDAQQEVMRIPRRKPSKKHLEAARKNVKDEAFKKKDPAAWTFAKETVLLDALIQSEPVRDVEIQTVKVGPAVFVTTPAEYFVQLGLDQKKAIKFPYVWPVSLANGCVGYVPTEEALSSTGGGYETRLSSYSNLIPKAGTMMRDKGIELAGKMKPDAEPKEAKHPPFKGTGWKYGNVPPEVD
ncbi:MAG: hypothetical protein GXP30_06395 [Verrucomicrobia bacterium]|nr:hypothetical protein [Verrucomicrobiota bacterium]